MYSMGEIHEAESGKHIIYGLPPKCSYLIESSTNEGKTYDEYCVFDLQSDGLDCVAVGGILAEYNFKEHVASDIAIDQMFLSPNNIKTQQNLYDLQNWTENNLMRLNENKTHYILFNRIKTPTLG